LLNVKFPRFTFNPSARTWFQLWKSERRANARLRRELLEWQQKVLQQAKVTPLFQPPPKPVESVPRPPIGQTAKNQYLAQHAPPTNVPTAEDILLAAEKARNGH